MLANGISKVFSRPLSPLSRAMSAVTDKKYYILRYEYVHDILNRRGPYRAEHLERAVTAKKDGNVVMGGALVDPPDAGVFIFNVSDKKIIEKFATSDPYVLNNLVTSYSIREWTVVI
ncbi:YCII-related [Plasmopara halstedii]|uniref:YCII-related n=1 Tax=Plasmopara halstedii TaxID=4781 RepID=A0A0P1AXX5_PLAHL|nr:YCII-related [Plasmopara halstedii]CEG45663.1 YCII-related [Plasmopara halstedii]|eukprot:XP_024582032.1 YCII-related [Plasmopara halstedii]